MFFRAIMFKYGLPTVFIGTAEQVSDLNVEMIRRKESSLLDLSEVRATITWYMEEADAKEETTETIKRSYWRGLEKEVLAICDDEGRFDPRKLPYEASIMARERIREAMGRINEVIYWHRGKGFFDKNPVRFNFQEYVKTGRSRVIRENKETLYEAVEEGEG
jgi:hypothetical protein